ncbi:MAG: hypothetical protein U0Q15_19210 [Kineosporiaceae bacterium]
MPDDEYLDVEVAAMYLQSAIATLALSQKPILEALREADSFLYYLRDGVPGLDALTSDRIAAAANGLAQAGTGENPGVPEPFREDPRAAIHFFVNELVELLTSLGEAMGREATAVQGAKKDDAEHGGRDGHASAP